MLKPIRYLSILPCLALLAAIQPNVFALQDAATPTPDIEVYDYSAPFPSDCSPADTAQIVLDFVEAFNRGDQDALKALFPSESTPSPMLAPTKLSWFSVSDGPTKVEGANNRDDLLKYFARRHAAGEHWTLLKLGMAAAGWTTSIGINYRLIREASDYPAKLNAGKGGVNCQMGVIHVWSMGTIPPYAMASPEPQPND